MSVNLNHYRDWLGIDSPTETPSYYELLGLRPLEADIAKIGAAFQRQTERLTPRLSGSEAAVAQHLMGELAEARMTLLTPTAKRAYDQALASRYPAASSPSSGDELSMVSNADALLPPAAHTSSSQETAPSAPASYAQASAQAPAGYAYGSAQPYPAAGHPVAQSYPTASQSYPSPQSYPTAPQSYPTAPQGYPPATYPAWQPQSPGSAAAYPANPYYAAPQAAAGYAAPASQIPAAAAPSDAMPVVRRKPARRRSNAVPALAGVAALVVVVVGGLWFYFQENKAVAVADGESTPEGHQRETATHQPTASHHADAADDVNKRAHERPAVKAPADAMMPSTTRPQTEKPSVPPPAPPKPEPAMPEPPKPETAKPESMKPETFKPETSKPAAPPSETPQQPAEMNASPDERKAVDEKLKSVRAALAARDVGKARDMLAEATIEATGSDTLADVNQLEVLTDYVEMFWNAVRQTLPKTELEEIEIDGRVLNVVEADENHIIVRVEGRNHDYRWQKLPNKLAYYLANRWLSADDPVRNMVLASFEIAEPKGDRANARALLNDAAAAGLNTKPLLSEMADAPRSKKT